MILDLFENYQELTAKEIIDRLDVSKQMTHIVINQLLEAKKIERIGHPPKTIYRLLPTPPVTQRPQNLSRADTDFLTDNFLVVTDTGNLLEGQPAFSSWCRQRSLPLEKTLIDYKQIRQKYAGDYDSYGIVNGLGKLTKTMGSDKTWLDQLCYLDYYAIEQFGKTRYGTLVHYAKQGQNKFLMSLLMQFVSEPILYFLERQQADAIAFVPPTIRREVQLMKYIQTRLNASLPVVEIKKFNGLIPIPQKSLPKLDERIKNAENTFVVTDRRSFQHVVLIDDAVGSGSTLNQIAAKIKVKRIANRVTGLAIVGSFEGFDVITEV
jgi:hypothetical protein